MLTLKTCNQLYFGILVTLIFPFTVPQFESSQSEVRPNSDVRSRHLNFGSTAYLKNTNHGSIMSPKRTKKVGINIIFNASSSTVISQF